MSNRRTTSPSTPALTIRLSSNTTIPLLTPQALAPATSTPLPLSRSHTHTLPLAASPTHRPSERDREDTAPSGPNKFRTNTSFGVDPVAAALAVVGIDRRYSCRILGECMSDEAKPDSNGDKDRPDPGDDVGSCAVAGASTTHLPSVCVSATPNTFRPHCSLISLSLRSSIHPFGASNVLVVFVAITAIDGPTVDSHSASREASTSASTSLPPDAGVFADITSSVAPTLQCAGYTGMAYASTSLYVEGDGVDRTSELGGNDVNELSVCL